MKTKGKETISELAKAFTYIDIERLDMGDSHEEIVEFLCEKAGLEFDSECADEDEYYYEKKSVEAYEKLIKDGSIQEILGSIVEEIYDHYDYLQRVMVYSKDKPTEIKEHPTVKAICSINDYIQSINNEDICSKEHCSKMNEVKEKLLSVDIELCYVGNQLGHNYFRYLNPDYYFHSNDVFTVGHILSEDEVERKLGVYTIHAEIQSSRQGYTVAFNRKDGNIVAHVYEYTKTYNPFNMTYEDINCDIIVDKTNLDESAKVIASKINELTENDFANGIRTSAELLNKAEGVTAVRKRRGR